MNLTIDTSDRENIILMINRGKSLIDQKTFPAHRQQAEKLLPEINQLLAVNKLKLGDLKRIIVADTGNSFTSLRIGVVTANALAFSLGIPVAAASRKPVLSKNKLKLVSPSYNQSPVITLKNKFSKIKVPVDKS